MYHSIPWWLALSLCFSSFAFASLKKDISKDANLAAVIVPDDGKAHNGYQILILPPDDFRKNTEIETGSNLENNYFKVVRNEDADALEIGDFDGDNVLYHLMVARKYYETLSANSGKVDPALEHKVIVRMRVTEAYNPVTHFAEIKSYNDARYIPANYDQKWQSEIWFHARKGQLEDVNWKILVASAGLSAALGGALFLPVTIPIDLYGHYNHGMDPAKMPNAIYHEAFHWATDTQGLFPMASCGDAVAENYANYFGSSLTGHPQLLEIKEFTSVYYKRNYAKVKAVKSKKTSMYNYTSFVPAIFWQVRDMLGADRADQIIWNSMLEFHGQPRHAAIPAALLRAAKKDPSITVAELDQMSVLMDKYYKSFANLDERFGLRKTERAPILLQTSVQQ